MTQLAELRAELRSLGSRRRRTRVGDVLLVGAGVGVAVLAVYYAADRLWHLNAAARLFVDALLLGGFGWFAVRKLFPTLAAREDEIDAALRLERRRGIDSDVVAALQFDAHLEEPDHVGYYGSQRLAEAVIDGAAETAGRWNLQEEPLDGAPRGRRLSWGAVLLVALVAALCYRQHAATFFLRAALLQPLHYPSNTRIVELKLNGRSVEGIDSFPGARRGAAVTVPLGRTIRVELVAQGTLPERAVVELVGDSGGATEIELTPQADRAGAFQGVLPAPVENLTGRATAGDDFTEPFALRAVPLPAVTVTLLVTPPPYAADLALEHPAPGRLYASVLEGSHVTIRVDGANKPLERVELTCGESLHALEPVDAERRAWRLEPAGTEFAGVAQPLEFALDVVDADGFSLLEPLRGSLALRADQPPSVTADVVTKFVLPAGKPTILYQAADDLGVQSLTVERQVLRLDGTTTADFVPIPIPPEAVRTAFAGRFPLELSSLQLHKGDKVTVRLQARDRRTDDAARATAQSEPLVLEVTDEQGLYQAMAETDQRSALKMDEIIQKQLLMTGKAGGTPAPRPTSTPTPTTPISPPPSGSGTGAKP